MIPFKSRKLVVLEANIDDMNPEWYDALSERLFEEGALDVTLIPVVMKKSRPAVLLQVLAVPAQERRLVSVILEESSSLGVRSYAVTRHELRRELREVPTRFGEVLVKIGRDTRGRVINVAPEYASCLRVSRKKKVPLKAVYREALCRCLA